MWEWLTTTAHMHASSQNYRIYYQMQSRRLCLQLRFITLLSIKYGAEDTFRLLACYTSSADGIINLAHAWERF